MSEFKKNYEKIENDCQEAFSKLNADKMTSKEKLMVLNVITMLDMLFRWISKRITEDEKKETNSWEKAQNFIGPDGLSSDCIYFDDIPVATKREATWTVEELEKGLNGYG